MRARAIAAVVVSVLWVLGFGGLLATWLLVSGHYFIELIWLPWSLLGAPVVAFTAVRRRLLAALVALALLPLSMAGLSLFMRYEETVAQGLAREVATRLASSEATNAALDLEDCALAPRLSPPVSVELRDFTFGSWMFVLESGDVSLGLELVRGRKGRWRGYCYESPLPRD